MISTQSAVYLLVPNESNERVLHPGRVLALRQSDVIQIGFDQPIAPAVGSDVNVFFDHNGKFFQQSGSIVAVEAAAAPAPTSDIAPAAEADSYLLQKPVAQTITFRCVGKPVSADGRGSYRVSVVALQAMARVEKERDCKLVDVSPEGLAVLTKQNYRLGTAVKMLFDYEDQHLEGLARVQTVRELPNGKFRCGLLVPSTEVPMRKSLQKITALVQRRQLQNLRRSA